MMPILTLSLMYWFHLLATVIWIGGLAMLTFVVWPGLMSLAGDEAKLSFRALDILERRFRPLSNVSLAVLLTTGLIQMGASSNYEGMLQITNRWSQVMLIKHGVIAGMIIVTMIIQFRILPELRRLLLFIQKGKDIGTDADRYRRYLQQLTLVNLVLGGLVLFFSALLTAL